MNIQDLSKKLREAREKATSGEWSVTRMHRDEQTWNQIFSSKTRRALFPEASSSSTFALNEDCEFIADAANNILTILNELDRLIQVEKVLKEAIEMAVDLYTPGMTKTILTEALKRADEIGRALND